MFRRLIDQCIRFVRSLELSICGSVHCLIFAAAFSLIGLDRSAIAQCASPNLAVRYVHPEGDDEANSGLCWEDAYQSLNRALEDLHDPLLDPAVTTIRLAGFNGSSAGVTYRLSDNPSIGFSSNGSFLITKPCVIEGGWQGVTGSGGSPGVRDIELYPTIISGDLDNDDDPEDPETEEENARSVIRLDFSGFQDELEASMTLDGLIIEAGRARFDTSVHIPGRGGAVYMLPPGDEEVPLTFVVRDCSFQNNHASSAGGAIALHSDGVFFNTVPIVLRRCRFENNALMPWIGPPPQAEPRIYLVGGGAVATEGSLTVVQCSFTGNRVAESGWRGGGAVTVQTGVFTGFVRVVNSEFIDNAVIFPEEEVDLYGEMGGALFATGSDLTVDVTGSLFAHNLVQGDSAQGGAIMILEADSVVVQNTTIAHNESINYASPIFPDGGGLFSNPTPTVLNSIIYSNIATDGTTFEEQISVPFPDSWDIAHSCIQGIDVEEFDVGNVDVNPMFVDANGWDFRLKGTSSLINLGDQSRLPDDLADVNEMYGTSEPLPWDLVASERVHGCELDMGAYELQRCCQGDLNDDCDVDGDDLAIILGGWGSCTGCLPDLNHDGTVDGTDMAVVLGSWGGCCETSEMFGGGGGLTPDDLAEICAFEDLASFIAWLDTLDYETMSSVLSLLIED